MQDTTTKMHKINENIFVILMLVEDMKIRKKNYIFFIKT